MLSSLESPLGKTAKRKRHNYSFKTVSNNRQKRLARKRFQSSTSNVTFQNILQNNIAKSLTRSYIPKDVDDDETLFEEYSKMKRELNMREENLKEELVSVREALRKSLEERLNCFEEISQISIQDVQLSSEHCSLKKCSKSEIVIVDDTEQNGCGDAFKTIVDGVSVTAKAEDFRSFKIETEHPHGSIKSHIVHKPSGNIEIVTQIECYSDNRVHQARSDLCSTVSRLVFPPTSISTTELMIKNTVSVKELEAITKTSHVYDSVTKILQKLNDTVVYALDHVNKNISKAMDSLNQNIKLALTVVVRDEIRKAVTEHFAYSQKNLVTSSTSHNNMTPTVDKEVEVSICEQTLNSSTYSTSPSASSHVLHQLQKKCDKCNCAIQTVPTHNTAEQATQLAFNRSMDLRPETEFVIKTTSFNLASTKALVEENGTEPKKRKVRSPNFTKTRNQENGTAPVMHSELFLTDGEYPTTNNGDPFLESIVSSSSKSAINLKNMIPLPNPEFLMLQFKSNSCLPRVESTDATLQSPTKLIESSTASSCVVTQALTEATINDIKILPSDNEETDDTFVTSHIYCTSHDENKTLSKTKCCFKITSCSSSSEKLDYVLNKKRRFTKSKSSIGADRKMHKLDSRKQTRKTNLPRHSEELVRISSYDCFQQIHAEYCKRNQRKTASQQIERRPPLENRPEPQKIERLKEKIKLANMCDEELKKLVQINTIHQKNGFESTLSGLQNALTSLKTKLEQADDKIKKVSDKGNTGQINKQLHSHIPRRKNSPKVLDVMTPKQPTNHLIDTSFETNNEKIVSSKLDDKKNIKKSIESKKKPSNFKSKRNLQSTTSSTKTTESRYQKTQVVQTPHYVQEELRHSKQELKNFFLFKQNILPASNTLRRSMPYLQLQDALTRRKAKNGINFKYSTETAVKDVTVPKPENFHRQIQKKRQ